MKSLYIFDLDGTLALIDHRRHHITLGNWGAFYAACVHDLPNVPVITVMELLKVSGADVWIFSGRSDEVRMETIDWLELHTTFTRDELAGPLLTMRNQLDYSPDHTLKHSWLCDMLDVDRERLVCVFDDREKVVRMWRATGVTCLQVAEGGF